MPFFGFFHIAALSCFHIWTYIYISLFQNHKCKEISFFSIVKPLHTDNKALSLSQGVEPHTFDDNSDRVPTFFLQYLVPIQIRMLPLIYQHRTEHFKI
jgi:hypothetical protein